MAELLLRLDRLPDGHPSSPYHDDGTRKSPVLRLRDLELPLPDEERTPAVSGKHDFAERHPAEPVADLHRTSSISHADDHTTASRRSSAADRRGAAARDDGLRAEWGEAG